MSSLEDPGGRATFSSEALFLNGSKSPVLQIQNEKNAKQLNQKVPFINWFIEKHERFISLKIESEIY